MTDQFVLEAPAHDQWVPLPLEGDVDDEVAGLLGGMIGHSATPDLIEDTAAWIAGTTRIARRDSDRLRTEQLLPTFGAWVLLPEPRLLLPGPVAYLRAGPLRPDATDDDAIGSVIDLSAELYGGLEVDELETASGRAFSVRRRPVRLVDGVRAVDEHRVVLWPRPQLELVVHLSLYVVDLVEGGRAAGPLRELAASLRWRVT